MSSILDQIHAAAECWDDGSDVGGLRWVSRPADSSTIEFGDRLVLESDIRAAEAELQKRVAELEALVKQQEHSAYRLADEIAALRKQAEKLAEDAELYRGLRRRACHGPFERFNAEYGWLDLWGQHEPGFDSAVRAAIAQEQEK